MERDDIIEYSLYNHHGEEEGKKIRKKLWRVFWILLVVTIVEVVIGFKLGRAESLKGIIMVTFITLTLLKAFYIVMTFMHLGDERKAFRYVVLIPYLVFIINMIIMILDEASYAHRMDQLFGYGKVENTDAYYEKEPINATPAPAH